MTTKLTLTIEKSVIQRAKEYAERSGRSLSDLIESYLESLIRADKSAETINLPPKLKKLFGAAEIPSGLDHKKEIRKILGAKGRK
jgi:hypothetical protein